jgi:ribosomal-protein-alanine N-acetyltransferase
MPSQLPELKTPRLLLRMGQPGDIPAILKYYSANRPFLEPFEPQRPDSFYTYVFWEAALTLRQKEFHNGESLKLFIFEKATPREVIGTINLNTIIRGAFYGATLGYGLSASKQGQGLMTEAGHRLIEYAFKDLNLHRIMAGYMPHNYRSGNVLKRLGFHIEGVAREYLFINGQWQDHILTSRINPDWQGPEE